MFIWKVTQWNWNLQFAGIMDEVAPVTAEEKELYKEIDFDVEDYCKDLGHERLIHHNDKVCYVWND